MDIIVDGSEALIFGCTDNGTYADIQLCSIRSDLAYRKVYTDADGRPLYSENTGVTQQMTLKFLVVGALSQTGTPATVVHCGTHFIGAVDLEQVNTEFSRGVFRGVSCFPTMDVQPNT